MADIRVLIVDDEPLARRGIRQLLAPHRDIIIVGECRDGREALRALDTLSPSLVFLDIQMPGLNGFGVVRARGPERMPPLVFVTAFDEFAVRAFEARALDYLVKPVSKARFEATLQHVRKQLQLASASDLSAKLRELLLAEEARRENSGPDGRLSAVASGRLTRLIVPTATGQLLIDPREIERVEADDYYSAIYAGGRRHLVREPLSALEAKLSRSEIVFVRVHRSAIVRLDRIREIISLPGGGAVAVMRDTTRVPVSRRRRDYLAGLLRRSAG